MPTLTNRISIEDIRQSFDFISCVDHAIKVVEDQDKIPENLSPDEVGFILLQALLSRKYLNYSMDELKTKREKIINHSGNSPEADKLYQIINQDEIALQAMQKHLQNLTQLVQSMQ